MIRPNNYLPSTMMDDSSSSNNINGMDSSSRRNSNGMDSSSSSLGSQVRNRIHKSRRRMDPSSRRSKSSRKLRSSRRHSERDIIDAKDGDDSKDPLRVSTSSNPFRASKTNNGLGKLADGMSSHATEQQSSELKTRTKAKAMEDVIKNLRETVTYENPELETKKEKKIRTTKSFGDLLQGTAKNKETAAATKRSDPNKLLKNVMEEVGVMLRSPRTPRDSATSKGIGQLSKGMASAAAKAIASLELHSTAGETEQAPEEKPSSSKSCTEGKKSATLLSSAKQGISKLLGPGATDQAPPVTEENFGHSEILNRLSVTKEDNSQQSRSSVPKTTQPAISMTVEPNSKGLGQNDHGARTTRSKTTGLSQSVREARTTRRKTTANKQLNASYSPKPDKALRSSSCTTDRRTAKSSNASRDRERARRKDRASSKRGELPPLLTMMESPRTPTGELKTKKKRTPRRHTSPVPIKPCTVGRDPKRTTVLARTEEIGHKFLKARRKKVELPPLRIAMESPEKPSGELKPKKKRTPRRHTMEGPGNSPGELKPKKKRTPRRHSMESPGNSSGELKPKKKRTPRRHTSPVPIKPLKPRRNRVRKDATSSSTTHRNGRRETIRNKISTSATSKSSAIRQALDDTDLNLTPTGTNALEEGSGKDSDSGNEKKPRRSRSLEARTKPPAPMLVSEEPLPEKAPMESLVLTAVAATPEESRPSTVQFEDNVEIREVKATGREWYSKEWSNEHIEHEIQLVSNANDLEEEENDWRGLEHIQKKKDKQKHVHEYVRDVRLKQVTLRRKQKSLKKNGVDFDFTEDLKNYCFLQTKDDRKRARWLARQDAKFVQQQQEEEDKAKEAELNDSSVALHLAVITALNPLPVTTQAVVQATTEASRRVSTAVVDATTNTSKMVSAATHATTEATRRVSTTVVDVTTNTSKMVSAATTNTSKLVTEAVASATNTASLLAAPSKLVSGVMTGATNTASKLVAPIRMGRSSKLATT